MGKLSDTVETMRLEAAAAWETDLELLGEDEGERMRGFEEFWKANEGAVVRTAQLTIQAEDMEAAEPDPGPEKRLDQMQPHEFAEHKRIHNLRGGTDVGGYHVPTPSNRVYGAGPSQLPPHKPFDEMTTEEWQACKEADNTGV